MQEVEGKETLKWALYPHLSGSCVSLIVDEDSDEGFRRQQAWWGSVLNPEKWLIDTAKYVQLEERLSVRLTELKKLGTYMPGELLIIVFDKGSSVVMWGNFGREFEASDDSFSSLLREESLQRWGIQWALREIEGRFAKDQATLSVLLRTKRVEGRQELIDGVRNSIVSRIVELLKDDPRLNKVFWRQWRNWIKKSFFSHL